MTKTKTTLVATVALALSAVSSQAQWTYIDVQDGVNFPGAGNTFEAASNSDSTWGIGDDGATFGWRFRNTGPGAPAFGTSAYTGRFGGQANGEPDPALYTPLSGLLADTDYFVRVYAVYPQNSTNLPVAGSRQGAEFSLDGGTSWEAMDNHGSILNWVDNSSELGAPLPGTAGDTRAWALLEAYLRTDNLGNARIDVRLPETLQDATLQDRFNLDGYAVMVVPEPAAFALAGLGAAALLIFRRRR